MKRLTLELQDDEGKLVTKSILLGEDTNDLSKIEESILLLSEILTIDAGCYYEDILLTLRSLLGKEAEEETKVIVETGLEFENSDEFLNELTQDPIFRESVFNIFKKEVYSKKE